MWTTIWQVIINNKYNKSKKRYSTEKEIVRFTYIRLSLYSSSYLKGEKRWRAFPRAILVFAGAILTRCRWAQQYSQEDLTNWGLYWSAQSETCSYDCRSINSTHRSSCQAPWSFAFPNTLQIFSQYSLYHLNFFLKDGKMSLFLCFCKIL